MYNKVTNLTPIDLEIVALYYSNYKKELHGREIARILDANHRTILLALKRLEEKHVLLSRAIGKNKMFHLNLQSMITREYLTSVEISRTIPILEKHFFLQKLLQDSALLLQDTPLLLF